MYINLLPQQFASYILTRKRLRQWGIVWGVVAVLGTAVLAVQRKPLADERAKQQDLQNQVRPLLALKRAIAERRRQMQVLDAQVQALLKIRTPDRSLSLLTILAKAAHSAQEPLQIERCSISVSAADAAHAAAAQETAASRSTVVLNGIAASDQALARFVDHMRGSSVFEQVELTACSQSAQGSKSGRLFQVECSFAR
jgi:phage-related minor tail protein